MGEALRAWWILDDTQIFLQSLFGDKPAKAAVQIWIKTAKPVTWFLSELDAAARIAAEQSQQFDVYVGCGIGAQTYDKPQRNRLKPDEVAGIPGVWADIDINGGPEEKSGAAPTLEAAMELANAVLPPTLVVWSGYGLQAWWLFETPWIFESVAERVKAERMVRGFQGALLIKARERGFRLDSTFDLSRILRVPGTLNHKGESPAPVSIHENEGNRYTVEEISEKCVVVSSGEASSNGLAVNIQASAALDNRVMQLVMDEGDFESLWRMNAKAAVVKGLRDSTLSGVEFEIARWLARAGLEPQGICDALVAWRNTHEPGDPRKKLRPERLNQTISRAISSISQDIEEQVIRHEQDDALDELAQVKTGVAEPNEQKLLNTFNKVIRGPKIKKLKQFSRDPATARFVIELEDGREVQMGAFGNIASQHIFRKQYGVATGHYPLPVKKRDNGPGWDDAVHALLKAAEVVDETEDSTAGETQIWVEEYVDMVGGTDRDSACQSNRPFVDDLGTYIPLRDFMRFLRRMGERIDASDVSARLRAIGFDRRTIGFADMEGKRSTRSYFTNTLPRPVGRPSGGSLLGE